MRGQVAPVGISIASLHHDPSQAWWDRAETWRQVAGALRRQYLAQSERSERLGAGWACRRADSYQQHARRLRDDLGQAAETAEAVSRQLAEMAELVEREDRDDRMEFHLPPGEVPQPTAEPFARDVPRRVPDPEREVIAQRLHHLTESFAALADRWARHGPQGTPAWDVPRGDVVGVQVTSLNGTWVVSTGDGTDVVHLHVDPATGSTTVTVTALGGTQDRHVVPAGQQVVLNTGRGHDVVLASGSHDHITVVTEDGVGDLHELPDPQRAPRAEHTSPPRPS